MEKDIESGTFVYILIKGSVGILTWAKELGQMWEGNSRGLSLSVSGCAGWKVKTVKGS